MLFARWFSAVERHPRFSLALLVVLLGAPGLASIPPIDRDEPEFAQPARQMLETGDFVDIRFQDAPFYEKPILTFWLQAGSAALFGGPELNRIWAYRLPSVLAVLLAALLTFELGLTLFDRRAALAAAALLTTMMMVQSQAHQARADALLLASMLGVVLPLARAYVLRTALAAKVSAPMTALFWFSLAAAILIKGPVVPVLLALAVATLSLLDRNWHWLAALRLQWGVPLFLLVLLPWPIAIFARHGASFFVDAWQSDILPKLISGQESHGAPPLTYALLSPLILWPASLLLPTAIAFAWRNRSEAAVRFCIASILPGWLLFELAPTKLPHYVMPLLPMLVLLMTAGVGRIATRPPSRASSRIGVALFLLAGLFIVAALPYAQTRLGNGVDWISALGVSALFVAVIVAAFVGWRGNLERSAWAAALCGMLATLLIAGAVTPSLQRLWIADRAAQDVRSVDAGKSPALVVGYHEPSLVFLLGTRTRFVNAEQAAAALKDGASTVAIVHSASEAAFREAAADRDVGLRKISSVEGIDPVHGRSTELAVWSTR
jgi:4-amino-4-deoxy-L-arabinose transferase-like glycosyltransferase